MGFLSKRINELQVGQFFVSKVYSSLGIAAIILKQWDAVWWLYIVVFALLTLGQIFIGWIAVVTGVWARFMVEQFKGSLLK